MIHKNQAVKLIEGDFLNLPCDLHCQDRKLRICHSEDKNKYLNISLKLTAFFCKIGKINK